MEINSALEKPDRWYVPFSKEMTDMEVELVLSVPPFNQLKPRNYSSAIPLHGIIKNDTRIIQCQEGDIIVREGDWGNTAYFVLDGSVRVEIEKVGFKLPAELLGRRETKKKSFWEVVSQWWRNHEETEYRDQAAYRARNSQLGMRGSGQETRIYLQDVPATLNQYKTVRLESGTFFGELAALGRIPRAATVFADSPTELLEIRWQGLRDLMRKDDSLQKHIDRLFRERALAAFLHNNAIFQHLDDQEMEELVQLAQFETFGKYDWAGSFKSLVTKGNTSDLTSEPLIAQEEEYPNGVYFMRSGLARLSQRHYNGHRTVGYLTPGQVYGLDEILQSWRGSSQVPLQMSLRAIGYVCMVFIPTPVLERFLLAKVHGQLPIATAQPGQVSYRGISGKDAGKRIQTDFLEFLVEKRFVNGTATMMIDMDRCTRCDDCVRACASTHDNNPRFLRQGPTHDDVMVANACMHCEDPVCMIECPTCSNNCPFDAIRMTTVRDEHGQLLRDMLNQPIEKATKCDLCVDQWGGPACQRACPHDALVRIDMRDLVSLANWHNR